MTRSNAVTRGIRVEVRARYLPERSDVDAGTWVFAYHVRITNESARVVQLVSRRWVITDADGVEEEGKSTYESYGIGVFFDYIGIDYAISTISVDMSSSDDTYETESSDLSLIISDSF